MSTTSPYRVTPTDGAHENLAARLNTYKSGPHYIAATRNPAMCSISCEGLTLPQNTTSFNETYTVGDFRKPDPMLKNVTIRFNGAGDTKLIFEAEAEIQCHTLDQFQKYEPVFCKQNNKVKFTWGYPIPRGEGYGPTKSIDGFSIATYSFNTTAEGFWIIKFTAIAPAMTIEELVTTFKIDTSKDRKYILNGPGGQKRYPVTSLIELLTYWAQSNGTKAIDEAEDGEVIIPDGDPKLGAIVIYDPEHLQSKDSGGSSSNGKDAANNNEISKTNNVVYISLLTLTEMFNNETITEYSKVVPGKQQETVAKLKIKFDEKLSFSYVDLYVRSAYPTRVLILGDEISNYKNAQNKGKDFLENVTNPDALTAAKVFSGPKNIIDLRKILVEKTLVLEALSAMFKDNKPSESMNPKGRPEGGVRVKEFFEKIFQKIKEATGDSISLKLSMHPDVYEVGDPKAYELYIFDENNGYTSNVDVWVFDPIGGDGTTRTCEITSGVGSQEQQGAAINTALKGADPAAEANGEMKNNTTDGRTKAYSEARTKINEILYDPGVLGDSAFDEIHMQALKDQLSTVRLGSPETKKYEMPLYPGLGMNIEIDGLWGLRPGCGIFTTQLPSKYKTAKVFFSIMTVTHTFSGDSSDWSTKLEGVLTNHSDVQYKP